MKAIRKDNRLEVEVEPYPEVDTGDGPWYHEPETSAIYHERELEL